MDTISLLLLIEIFLLQTVTAIPLHSTVTESDVHHIYLGSNSSCAAAFPNSRLPSAALGELKSIFNFTSRSKDDLTLQLVNAGTGTTGSREVYFYIRNKYPTSCHWYRCFPKSFCAEPGCHPMKQNYEKLRNTCVDQKETESWCTIEYWMEKLPLLIKDLVSAGVDTVHDIPTNFFIREYLDLMPPHSLIVLHTVRDPYTWVLKRIAEHPLNDVMCDMRLEENHHVSTAFHILECLEGNTGYVHERLTNMAHFIGINQTDAQSYLDDPGSIPVMTKQLVQEVADFYADYTQRVMNTAATRARRYRTICVWDEDFP